MISLIQNEFLKLHAKKGMYIVIGVLVFLQIAVAAIIKKWTPPEFGIDGFILYADYFRGPTIMLATVFGIMLAARTVTEEFQQGTIKQLLIRPRKRITILLSKYVSVILAVFLVCIVSLFSALVIGLLAFGGGVGAVTFPVLAKKFLYDILPMLFYPTVALFLSTIFRKSVLPLVITMFFYLLEGVFKGMIAFFVGKVAQYTVLFHLDLSMYDSNQLVSGRETPPFTQFDFTTSLLFVFAHFAVLLIASGILFQKRDVL